MLVCRTAFVFVLLVALAPAAPAAPPARLRAEVVEVYPHDPGAYTQGLVLHDGKLYESTGLYGRSSLREVELATGKVLHRVDLPPSLFGEGLALQDRRLVQLTWREGVALTYDLATLAQTGEIKYSGEGWGLCFDGAQFIETDGSQRLIFRDPATFAVVRQVAVAEDGRQVTALNELECAGDEVYANVWFTDRILAVAKSSGNVRAVVDASGLLSTAERAALSSDAVLNGIAADPANGTFLITGKRWPKLFRVRFVPE